MAVLKSKQQTRLTRLENKAAAGEDLRPKQQKRLERLRAKQAAGYQKPEQAAAGFTTDIYNAGTQQLPGVTDAAFNPIDFGALPTAPGTQDLAGERARIEEQLYKKYTSGFGDQQAQERQAMEQRLAERGITPGSGEAYKNEMDRFDKSWNDRFDQARQSATEYGGGEWQRAFGIGSQGRSDALGEQMIGRQFPLQQMQGFMGLGQAAQTGDLGYKGIKSSQDIARLNADTQKSIAGIQADTARYAADSAARASQSQSPNLTPPPPPPSGLRSLSYQPQQQPPAQPKPLQPLQPQQPLQQKPRVGG